MTGRPNLSHETKSSGVYGNKEIFPCSADHGHDWQADPQLPPVIGAPRHLGFVAGTLRGSLSPVCYGSLGVQFT